MAEKFDNGLSLAQTERLVILVEELTESAKAACKVLRWGYESKNPATPDTPTNRKHLEIELGDVVNAVAMLGDSGDLNMGSILTAAALKAEIIGQFTNYQEAAYESEELLPSKILETQIRMFEPS